MKKKLLSVTLILSFICALASGQVTEGEKNLRTLNADTTQGWKKGAFSRSTLPRLSLTNWVAGGQNSVAAEWHIIGFRQTLKRGNRSGIIHLTSDTVSLAREKEIIRKPGKPTTKLIFVSKYGRQAYQEPLLRRPG